MINGFFTLLIIGVLMLVVSYLAKGRADKTRDIWMKRSVNLMSALFFLLGMFYLCGFVGVYFDVFNMKSFALPLAYGSLVTYVVFVINDVISAIHFARISKWWAFIIEVLFAVWFSYEAVKVFLLLFSPESIDINKLL